MGTNGMNGAGGAGGAGGSATAVGEGARAVSDGGDGGEAGARGFAIDGYIPNVKNVDPRNYMFLVDDMTAEMELMSKGGPGGDGGFSLAVGDGAYTAANGGDAGGGGTGGNAGSGGSAVSVGDDGVAMAVGGDDGNVDTVFSQQTNNGFAIGIGNRVIAAGGGGLVYSDEGFALSETQHGNTGASFDDFFGRTGAIAATEEFDISSDFALDKNGNIVGGFAFGLGGGFGRAHVFGLADLYNEEAIGSASGGAVAYGVGGGYAINGGKVQGGVGGSVTAGYGYAEAGQTPFVLTNSMGNAFVLEHGLGVTDSISELEGFANGQTHDELELGQAESAMAATASGYGGYGGYHGSAIGYAMGYANTLVNGKNNNEANIIGDAVSTSDSQVTVVPDPDLSIRGG